MTDRNIDRNEIADRIQQNPVTAILGPRQSGKTTLANQFKALDRYDLENPADAARLENPVLELKGRKGLIVIDEIQRKPDLFQVIRYLVDQEPELKFLILGSASQELIRQSSESLAGRISYYPLFGFRVNDVPVSDHRKLWLHGGFPRAYNAATDVSSYRWRQDYIRTYLERDIPGLGIDAPPETLRRFWLMLSHYHGNILNYSELSRSFGFSDKTARRYVDILKGTFMVRLLMPFFANLGKRLVKSPKIYVRDSGIFHALQNIETGMALSSHPKSGASWEGFAMDAVIRSTGKNEDEFYFYATHSESELDLFWENDGQRYGCEFKLSDAVRTSKSMRNVKADLKLTKLWVVYPGEKSYALGEDIFALPLSQIPPRWIY